MHTTSKLGRVIVALAVLVWTMVPAVSAHADEILVSAAASLTDAFNEIGRSFSRTGGHTTVRFNFGASGSLQQQVEQGAPVDVFASASPREMDALQRAKRLEASTRINFAGNRLVLITPRDGRVRQWSDLAAPWVRRVALANPASVPAGRYGEQTLRHRGLWSAVRPKAVLGENVRQTLAYVANGDADAGLVFATDARSEPGRVRVVRVAVPGQDHTPITYPAAVVAGAPNPGAARRFVAYLRTPAAQRTLRRFGFVPLAAHPRR